MNGISVLLKNVEYFLIFWITLQLQGSARSFNHFDPVLFATFWPLNHYIQVDISRGDFAPKNEDNLKDKDNIKNEDDFRNENNPKHN